MAHRDFPGMSDYERPAAASNLRVRLTVAIPRFQCEFGIDKLVDQRHLGEVGVDHVWAPVRLASSSHLRGLARRLVGTCRRHRMRQTNCTRNNRRELRGLETPIEPAETVRYLR